MQKRIILEVTAKRGKRRPVPVEVKFKWREGIAKRLEQKFGMKVLKPSYWHQRRDSGPANLTTKGNIMEPLLLGMLIGCAVTLAIQFLASR